MTDSLLDKFSKAKADLKSKEEVYVAQNSEMLLSDARLRNWMGATNIISPLYVSSVKLKLDGLKPDKAYISNTAKQSAQIAYALLRDSVAAGCPITESTAPGLYRHYLGRSGRLLTDILGAGSNVSVNAIVKVMQGLFFAVSSRNPISFDDINKDIIKNIVEPDIQDYLVTVSHAIAEQKYIRDVSMKCSLYNLSAEVYLSIESNVSRGMPSHMASKAILTTSVMGLMDAWSADFKSEVTDAYLLKNKTNTIAMFIQNTSKLISQVSSVVLASIIEGDPQGAMKPTFPSVFQRKMYPVLDELIKLTSTYSSAISKNSEAINKQLRSEGGAPTPSILSVDAWRSFLTMSHQLILQSLVLQPNATTVEDLLYTTTDLLSSSAKLGLAYERALEMDEVSAITKKHIHESMIQLTVYLSQFYQGTSSLVECSDENHPVLKGIKIIVKNTSKSITHLVRNALEGVRLSDKCEHIIEKMATSMAIKLTQKIGCAKYSKSSGSFITQMLIASFASSVSLYKGLTEALSAEELKNSEMLFDSAFSGICRAGEVFMQKHVEENAGNALDVFTDDLNATYLITDFLSKVGIQNTITMEFVRLAEKKVSINLQDNEALESIKKAGPDLKVGV
jgi:hypothetical protein